MGGDGGTVPRRNDIIRKSARPERDEKAARDAKWALCALTQDALVNPCCDSLGFLLSRDDVILGLVENTLPPFLSHLKLRDLLTLRLHPDASTGLHACPLSGLIMNGTAPFYAVRHCGCVLSQRALREHPGDNTGGTTGEKGGPTSSAPPVPSACPACAAACQGLVKLNPSDEERAELLALQQQEKDSAAKKGKDKREKEKDKSGGSKKRKVEPPRDGSPVGEPDREAKKSKEEQ